MKTFQLEMQLLTSTLMLFLLGITSLQAQGPYAPAAGQAGTTAIHKDSSAFKAWASDCVLMRGPMDISNPGLGEATHGEPKRANGKAGDGFVVSLGDGGTATLTFPGEIYNGPGPDFAVFENTFSDDFLELAFVEVSSDGVNFFRFDAVSLTQDSIQTDAFGPTNPTNIYNLAGKYRQDYGVPFDLEELSGLAGLNTDSITHVRIIDVVGSIADPYATYDSQGHKVNDPWPTAFESSGFDLDAVGVLNFHGPPVGITEPERQPLVLYPVPAQDRLYWQTSGQKMANLQIMDLLGEVVLQSSNTNNGSLEVQDLPAGWYLLRWESPEGKQQQPFLKQ